ncbi:MAG TPA: hypothetical protein PKW29_05175, partial [Clostridia bacterium]|nr:hypothetical protein [Clostridia bacterium]
DSLAGLPTRSVILELPSSFLFPCHSFLHYIVFKVRGRRVSLVLRDSFCIIANPIRNVNAFFRKISIFL